MPTIRIERPHRLGLRRARAIARRWAQQAERDHGLRCSVQATDDGDTIDFSRPGVQGRLDARADGFAIEAELGWGLLLLRARIEREIEAQLDAAIAAETTPKRPAARGRRG